MDNRVKVGLFIDKGLIEQFRALIQKKYNTYEKGLLSYEAEMALRNWLSLHTNAQTSLDIKKPNPTPKVVIIFSQVKNYLLSNFYFELKSGQQININHLKKAIMELRGSDTRTVNKWIHIFHKMGLIKPITSATWEIL